MKLSPIPAKLTPFANWTDDCCGKKDFDGPFVSVSTRYWPRGGGYLVVTNLPGQPVQTQDSVARQEIRPSAHSSIVINYDDNEHAVLAEKEFEADTEEQVKAHVESWVNEQYDRVVRAVRAAFKR